MVKKEKKIKKKNTIKSKSSEKSTLKSFSKQISKKQNIQLIWFFVVVIVAFASFLIPYYYLESKKSFEYGGADWTIEKYGELKIYHGRFPALNGKNLTYNIFIRNDPRTNSVPAEGNFLDFKYGNYISISEEINSCRGEIPRIMFDLAAFLKTGVGVDSVSAAASSQEFSNISGLPFANCSHTRDKTVIIIEKSKERGVVQSLENSDCYTISISDCNDIAPVEKFMVSIVASVNKALDEAEEKALNAKKESR